MTGKRGWCLLVLALGALLLVGANSPAVAQTITLHGASQFDDNHSYNQTMLKFAEAVQKYYGKPVNFVLHRNRELGLEKDYFAYMSQGLSVDYAVVAPSHMATFSKAATIMDMPFLFRDIDHWNKVLSTGEALQPIADDVLKKADVMLIGYAGGGVRNIVANIPVHNMAELKGLPIRVMGAPIQTSMFRAITAAPTVIAYDEVYNAIQTGVIKAGENEAPGWQQMKWNEVAPYISLTQHAITIRPLCFSAKTFRKLPKDLQAAILKAGRDGAAWGRKWERDADDKILKQLEAEKKITLVPFADRAKLLELAAPVKEAFAKEIGAEKILAGINAVK
ncbi:MAG TPA: TRAP transporter substrate-binding protein [Candidatus Methylomirabilis sp.]|nr:TRAP transporter substrate-binding protein [Candidatus Methylomirabilis sp.]